MIVYKYENKYENNTINKIFSKNMVIDKILNYLKENIF